MQKACRFFLGPGCKYGNKCNYTHYPQPNSIFFHLLQHNQNILNMVNNINKQINLIQTQLQHPHQWKQPQQPQPQQPQPQQQILRNNNNAQLQPHPLNIPIVITEMKKELSISQKNFFKNINIELKKEIYESHKNMVELLKNNNNNILNIIQSQKKETTTSLSNNSIHDTEKKEKEKELDVQKTIQPIQQNILKYIQDSQMRITNDTKEIIKELKEHIINEKNKKEKEEEKLYNTLIKELKESYNINNNNLINEFNKIQNNNNDIISNNLFQSLSKFINEAQLQARNDIKANISNNIKELFNKQKNENIDNKNNKDVMKKFIEITSTMQQNKLLNDPKIILNFMNSIKQKLENINSAIKSKNFTILNGIDSLDKGLQSLGTIQKQLNIVLSINTTKFINETINKYITEIKNCIYDEVKKINLKIPEVLNNNILNKFKQLQSAISKIQSSESRNYSFNVKTDKYINKHYIFNYFAKFMNDKYFLWYILYAIDSKLNILIKPERYEHPIKFITEFYDKYMFVKHLMINYDSKPNKQEFFDRVNKSDEMYKDNNHNNNDNNNNQNQQKQYYDKYYDAQNYYQ